MSLDARAFQMVPELAAKLKGVDTLLGLRNEPVWVILPFRLEVK
ncbi:MAG: hypothetical protein U0797_07260 [Gemmataceae bacterium]